MEGWRAELVDLAAQAPAWVRGLASEELHIGGFTNAQLAHPVLDLRGVDDEALGCAAAAWFCAAAIAAGAGGARVLCGTGARTRELAAHLRRELRFALERSDDENAALLRYFDVYPKPAAGLSAAAVRRLVAALRKALAALSASATPPRTETAAR